MKKTLTPKQLTNRERKRQTQLQAERVRRFVKRDAVGRHQADMILSKARPITLYEVPEQDRDLWSTGIVLAPECEAHDPESEDLLGCLNPATHRCPDPDGDFDYCAEHAESCCVRY